MRARASARTHAHARARTHTHAHTRTHTHTHAHTHTQRTHRCQEEYSTQVRNFYTELGITVFEHGVSGNKEPFVDIRYTLAYNLKPQPSTLNPKP